MTPRSRKVAVFVGTAALAAGAGIGVASQSSSSAATNPGAPPGMTRGGGDLSGLADALGVSETRLREAMDSGRRGAAAAAGHHEPVVALPNPRH